MLEIYANGKRLQLPEDISVDLTFENPFLMQDSIPATYSMSFTLPATRENLQLIGNANRLAAAGQWTEMDCRIMFNLATICLGKLKLQETEKNLKFSFIGSLLPDAVKEKMSKLAIGRYDFGTGTWNALDFATGWSGQFRWDIFNMATLGDEFAACPVRVTDAEWEYDPANFGDWNAGRMYLNMWNVNNGDFLFRTYSEQNPVHGAIFPQPYLNHLIGLVLGSKLNNNYLNSIPELQKLCMVTSYHWMFFNGISNQQGMMLDSNEVGSYPRYFYLSSFFNRYSFNDFLKNILKIFCCSLMPRIDGKWDIVHNKAILDGTSVVDWTAKLAGVPVTGMQKAQAYRYGYGSETPAGNEYGIASLDSPDDLMAVTTVPGTYKIAATGEIYIKKLESEDPDIYSYERVKSGLGSEDNTDEDDDREAYDMSSDVTPVKMRPDEYWYENANLTKYPWYIAEFSGDRMKRDQSPMIGFMRGFYNVLTKQTGDCPPNQNLISTYPLLSPYNYDPAGNKVGDYSLAWEGADGLISKFHTDFKAYIERDRTTLQGLFQLTPLDLKNLDYKKKIYIRGKKYYLKKIETTIRRRSISLCKCELIEA